MKHEYSFWATLLENTCAEPLGSLLVAMASTSCFLKSSLKGRGFTPVTKESKQGAKNPSLKTIGKWEIGKI